MAGWTDLHGLVQEELRQRREEGYDLTGMAEAFAALDAEDTAALDALYDRILACPKRADFAYEEPSDLEDIRADSSDWQVPVKNIAEGMIVDFVDADGNVLVGGRTVTKVDRKGKKVSVNGTTLTSTNVPNNSRIVIQNSNGLEITGLGAIFSDSATLYGVNRADHDWMNPYKQTSVGTISETKIQTAIDYLEEVSGSKVNFIVCSWGVKRALAEQLSTYKRVVDTVELEGGYKAMSFNGIPVVADRFCPDGTMYLLNTNDFCLHQLCDWQWLEGEDGKVLKQIAGKSVYTATVCTRPCGQAMLSGITEA